MTRPIEEIMAELQQAIAEQTEAREEATTGKARHISKMAKNLAHGDVAMTGQWGFVEINVWMRMGDTVTYGENQRTNTVPADQRVTIRRG